EGKGYDNAAVVLEHASQRAKHEPLSPPHEIPSALFPPGYPAILGALFWGVRHALLPHNLVAAAVSLNVALGTATVLMAFELARRARAVRGRARSRRADGRALDGAEPRQAPLPRRRLDGLRARPLHVAPPRLTRQQGLLVHAPVLRDEGARASRAARGEEQRL